MTKLSRELSEGFTKVSAVVTRLSPIKFISPMSKSKLTFSFTVWMSGLAKGVVNSSIDTRGISSTPLLLNKLRIVLGFTFVTIIDPKEYQFQKKVLV